MKKKIIITIFIISIVIILKLIYNLIINNIIIMQYNNGKYLENEAKTLTYVNLQQRYISHYNLGNIHYQNAEYEDAILEYQKALKNIIPEHKECKIRINYALAICKTVQLDETSQDSINSAIEKYKEAINILTEKGCAGEDGHNQDAEQLRYDIQSEINRLENLRKNGTTSKEENNEQKQTDSQNAESIEEKIKDIKEEAAKEQRKVESDGLYREEYYGEQKW